jgi:hypothetical protein
MAGLDRIVENGGSWLLDIDVDGQVDNDSEDYNEDPEPAVNWFLGNVVVHLETGLVVTLASQTVYASELNQNHLPLLEAMRSPMRSQGSLGCLLGETI